MELRALYSYRHGDTNDGMSQAGWVSLVSYLAARVRGDAAGPMLEAARGFLNEPIRERTTHACLFAMRAAFVALTQSGDVFGELRALALYEHAPGAVAVLAYDPELAKREREAAVIHIPAQR